MTGRRGINPGYSLSYGSARHSARLVAAALALLGGCAGSGTGLDVNGRPLGEGGGANTPLTANLKSIQDNVFTPICTVCHAGAGAPQGLRLDAANAYTLLVGTASTEVPAIQRVKPGDPNNSYIIQKLEGHAGVGAQMPFGGPPLASNVIAVIRQWITDGAANSPAVAAASSLAISAVVPANGDTLSEPPPQIAVSFIRDLDTTRVDANSMRLERVGAEPVTLGAGPATRLVAARLLTPAQNPRALLLIPAKPLAPGRYRVVLRGDAGLELADTQGAVLTTDARTPNGDWLVTSFDVQAAP